MDTLSSSSSSTSSSMSSLPLSGALVKETRLCTKPKTNALPISISADFKPKIIPQKPNSVNLSVFGKITAILENCVIIQGNPSSPTLNAGSVLFLEDGTYFGEIYETFGPVRLPYYVLVSSNFMNNQLSFNDPDQGATRLESNIQLEECSNNMVVDSVQSFERSQSKVSVYTLVYFVPSNSEFTTPVFYDQLAGMKGSDASWAEDVEPPPEVLDFSDDEQERLHKRNLRMKRKVGNLSSDCSARNTPNVLNSNRSLLRSSGSKLKAPNCAHMRAKSLAPTQSVQPFPISPVPHFPPFVGQFCNQQQHTWNGLMLNANIPPVLRMPPNYQTPFFMPIMPYFRPITYSSTRPRSYQNRAPRLAYHEPFDIGQSSTNYSQSFEY